MKLKTTLVNFLIRLFDLNNLEQYRSLPDLHRFDRFYIAMVKDNPTIICNHLSKENSKVWERIVSSNPKDLNELKALVEPTPVSKALSALGINDFEDRVKGLSFTGIWVKNEGFEMELDFINDKERIFHIPITFTKYPKTKTKRINLLDSTKLLDEEHQVYLDVEIPRLIIDNNEVELKEIDEDLIENTITIKTSDKILGYKVSKEYTLEMIECKTIVDIKDEIRSMFGDNIPEEIRRYM